MEKSRAAFIYLVKGLDPEKQNTVIDGADIEMKIYGVGSYMKACEIARALVRSGTESIILCGGFGYRGTAMIKKAVPGIPVASAWFDYHPGLGKSGDEVFNK